MTPPPFPIADSPAQVAVPGTRPPAARSYWVIEGLLAGGAYPPPASDHDRIEDLLRSGIRTFINLVTEDERNNQGEPFEPYVDRAKRIAEQSGDWVACLRFPMPDLSVPSSDRMRSTLDAIDLSLAAKRPVYVHCYGGVGRTATVVGCWLIRHGLARPETVLEVIQGLRNADEARRQRRAPETTEQVAMVVGWEE